MAQQVNLKAKGLYTAPNDFSGIPEGAMDTADDVVIDHDNLVESRRGFSKVTGTFTGGSSRVNTFTNYQTKQIIAYNNASVAYYNSSSWNNYSGTYAPPDSTLACNVRFVEANQNLYWSTSAGVYKIDSYSATPALSGVPKGLDVQLSLTGSSGFLTTNSVVSVTGTTSSGSPTLSKLSSSSSIAASQYVYGSGITTGTTVSSITTGGTVASGSVTTAIGSTTITAINTTTGFESAMAVDQVITGSGIPSNTRITSINTGAHTAVISNAATGVGAITATITADTTVTMSGNASASATVSITFSSGSQVGYRILWGIKDANNNVILGAPSQFNSITNTNGTTANVQITSTTPSGITTSHFYQIYRSAATVSSSTVPLDDMQLVYEGNPSSSDISNGYIQITDSTPDSLKGAYLYTGVTQQGISQQNERPPYCKDFCNFKNFMIYANTKGKHQLKLTILAVGGSSGIAVNDTLTIASVTYTAKSSETASSGEFKVFTSGTDAQNITDTANSLIKVINRYASNTTVYAYLLSGPSDLPGQIIIEERGFGGSTYYAVASAHGSAYSPALPTAGTTIASAQATNKNGLIISKQSQPESAPSVNLLFAGSASKEILRVIPLRDYVVILKQDGIYRLSGANFSNFTISPFDLTTKIIAPNSAVQLSNEVWGLFDQGVCSVSDTGVNVRSRPIEDVIKSLFGTALSTVKTVSFGVGYETDRKYILALPAASGDTYSTQQYVYSTFTSAWVRWTRSCTAGFADPTDDKLYLGNGTENSVSSERKNYDYTDHVDESISVTISSSSNYSVVLSSVTGVTVGDILYKSSTVSSVITAVTIATNTVTVTDLLTWGTGSASVLPAINNVVQWKPAVAGNPAFVRQYSEGAVLFKRTKFVSASAAFYSDVDQSFESTTISGYANGAWGLFTWGSQNWGGVSRPRSVRFLVPQNKQMCSQLSVKLTIREGYSNWALEGLSLSFYEANQEIA